MKTKIIKRSSFWGIVFLILQLNTNIVAQNNLAVFQPVKSIKPLEKVILCCSANGILLVKDAKNREYMRTAADKKVAITVAGAAGWHKAVLLDKWDNPIDSTSFLVEAKTNIDDGGKIGEMFQLFHHGMLVDNSDGFSQVNWNGKTYRFFVPWVLDNNNTGKGMKYFSPYSGDMVDLFRQTQKPDGMIWSFVNADKNGFYYYETAYGPINFFRKDRDAWFVRQPVENHVEYNFVNMMYQHWKASGDNAWMKTNLECASRALDYCVTDTIRWSKRFELLKRPYCIDSWDFQVDDEYTPATPISPTMVVVPEKTKYGIFFGDNTGYFDACNQLADMLEFAGQHDKAKNYRDRASDILKRLTALAWNGKFFTHFIDEDPTVKRNLGVDEKSQIAQGNMYSINRGLSHEMSIAIIKTYLNLKENLPVGSPGEWYAIYPPFERGFGPHNEKWQYMNGGVAGHAAGELARGAYENGYENYASDILNRLTNLGKQTGNRVWFSFTGSIPPPPPAANFKAVDISGIANMDIWDKGGKGTFPWMNDSRAGNDMRGLPTGPKVFQNIPFTVLDPGKNQRRVAIALSVKPGFPEKVEVLVNDIAAAIYLLHSSSDNMPATIAGAVTFQYADGTSHSQYLKKGDDITNWWFSDLENDHAGVAWSGPNPVSAKVGVCRAAVINPNPSKKIAKLIFHAPLEGGIYALLGITLADRVPYVKPKVESFGGPDNWAAANAMAALVEGLAGVKDNGLAYSHVALSPRWTSSGTDSVNVTVHYPASNCYVAYQYQHFPQKKEILITLTGSGEDIDMHLLLPEGTTSVNSVASGGKAVHFATSKMENSQYVDFKLDLPKAIDVMIKYN
ncbi:MAG: hypothetical protein D4R64_09710 [Porphyromonadaceae bacterium]|nr:MAG: hypothetical protein D4R64_09710 [Porphyromonadaceae bacterium]